jgi:hypothetical protein
MQGVCEELLDLQNKQTGLRCNKSYISWPCSYEIYQEKMLETTERLKADDISHVVKTVNFIFRGKRTNV